MFKLFSYFLKIHHFFFSHNIHVCTQLLFIFMTLAFDSLIFSLSHFTIFLFCAKISNFNFYTVYFSLGTRWKFEIRKKNEKLGIKAEKIFSFITFSFQIINNHQYKIWEELFKVPGVNEENFFSRLCPLLSKRIFCSLKGNFSSVFCKIIKIHAHRKRNIYRERIWRNGWSWWSVWWRIWTTSIEFTFVRHR